MAQDDISKKVLIEIDLASDDANAAVADLKNKVDSLKVAVIANKQAISDAKTAQAQFNAEMAKAKLTQQGVKTAIDQERLARLKATEATKASKQAIDAAAGSYNETQAKVRKLTQEVKAMGDAMGGDNPKVKALQAEINKLNSQLINFDAKMKVHTRNVGNYSSILSGLNQTVGRLIPGFNQFSGALQSAAQGFNAMGSGAKAAASDMESAEAGTGALGGAMFGLIAVIASVVAALVAESTYLLQFQKYADGLSKTWAGIKGSAEGLMTYLNTNNEKLDDNFTQFKQHWSDFFHSIGLGYKEASTAQGLILDLARQSKNAATLTAAEDMRVQLLIKDIRDRTTSAAKAQKDYNEVLEINSGQYKRNHELALQMFKSQTDAAIAGLGLTKEQKDSITDLSLGYEKLTSNAKKLLDQQIVGKDFLDKYNEGLQGIISVENKKAQSDEMAKIRDDMKQSRANTAAEHEKALQEEIARATEAANSEKIASTTKMLRSQYEAFAKSLSETDEAARQSIFKLQQEIEKQQAIEDDKRHDQKTRDGAKNFIKAANDDIKQIREANYLETAQMAIEHNRQMIELAAKGALDLKAVKITNIQDTHKRELAVIENTFQEKLNTVTNDDFKLQQTIRRLGQIGQPGEIADKQTEIDKETDARKKKSLENELQALKTTLNQANDALGINQSLVLAYEKQKQEAIEKTNLAYYKQETAAIDEKNLIEAQLLNGGKSSPLNNDETEAKREQLKNEEAFELQQTWLTENQKALIKDQYRQREVLLDQEAAGAKSQLELNLANKTQGAIFNILEQSLQRSFQAQEIYMEREKSYELNNQALTSTQKYEVSEKYRVKEGQQKQKEFKQEQELNIGKALMNGALAVVKAYAEEGPIVASAELPFLIAETAVEIATIAAQKPPAYATGGLHYSSDGRGGRLPGYSKTDNTNAYLRSGEGVVVSEAMQVPWARNLVSAVNQSFGGRPFETTVPLNSWFKPGFAAGGLTSTYTPTSDNGLRPMVPIMSRMHPDDVSNIVNGIAGAIQNMPKPIIDVKDVNRQQGLLGYVQDLTRF